MLNRRACAAVSQRPITVFLIQEHPKIVRLFFDKRLIAAAGANQSVHFERGSLHFALLIHP